MALAYGMTLEQYFFQDPELFYNYKKSFEMKQELDDINKWQQGLYFKKALESTPLWVYGMVDGNKMKLEEYPKIPFKKENNEEKTNIDEETLKRERFRAFTYFDQVHKANLKRQRK